MQKWTAKRNLREKLGKEHLDCKKSTLAKSQQSTWSKSTGWRQQADRWWCQQMMWRWHNQVTSAKVDVARMTSANNQVVREARGPTSSKILLACESAWTVRWCRFFSNDADRRRMILMVSTATISEIPWWRVRRVDQLCWNFDRRVVGCGWLDVDVSSGDV